MPGIKRKLYQELTQWKGQASRKPLLLFGARQVGKTFLVCEQFAPIEFKKFHIFDFKDFGNRLQTIFEQDFNVQRIISELSILKGDAINLEQDLIVFDEVQECPLAVESLKYFCEAKTNTAIIATGSMLRVKLLLSDPTANSRYEFSYPVGKVTECTLYPLCFEEFIDACGNQLLSEAFQRGDRSLIAHDKLLELYRDYLFVGGMPEAVSLWQKRNENITQAASIVRKLQLELISAYRGDFIAKGNVINGTHLAMIYDALFTQIQLSMIQDGSAKRFKFKNVVPKKSRFADLQNTIDWLEQAGMAHKVYVIDCNPLSSPDAFIRHNIFKLLPHDIGLANAKLQHSYKEIRLDKLDLVKGALGEIFVANELRTTFYKNPAHPLLGWVDKKAKYEVEFLLKSDDYGVYPMEVKAGSNTTAVSFNKYKKLYKPKVSIKLSTRAGGLKDSAHLTLPIYYVSKHAEFLVTAVEKQ